MGVGSARREDERPVVKAALGRLRQVTGVPVAFGGGVEGRTGAVRFRLSELAGASTNALRGLLIEPQAGLGGKAASLGRVLAVQDYCASRSISHDYDVAVRSEGLRAVAAVPVVVRGTARAVLYAALRDAVNIGDDVLRGLVDAARWMEQELVVSDEVDRRIALMEGIADADERPSTAEWEAVRLAHAELRLLALRADSPALRAELLGISELLSPERSAEASVRLTPREVDVLSCAALGCGNAEIARRLGVGAETVKSYLRSAMVKLGAHSRAEAVMAARLAGQLP
ncbi:helix-turn-helix transcriptional regulator [Actinocorallia libanotica]|uniref:helix-turn-helix transcriptional regulator n=1 Tax=Actinocorallia libanotica TaxID=46162 RepID=UPI0031CFB3CB